MKTLKLHYPTGHPLWKKDEYTVELPSGEFYSHDYNIFKILFFRVNPDLEIILSNFGRSFKIIVKESDGIYFQYCNCSSGSGKSNIGNPFKIIDESEYDQIIYVGEPLELSDELKEDLRINRIPN